MKVLLVDDTELFLDLEKSYLQRESFVFLTARSGVEAFSLLKRDKPDIIILDLVMPGMDGDIVCREIKEDPATRNIPVIMVSRLNQSGIRERCFAAGCDAFVAKPIKREELLDAIDHLLVIAQRRFARVPTHLPCLVREGDRERNAWIQTLSEGGLFLDMTPLPELGTVFEVVFSLPNPALTIRSRVQVRWHGHTRADGPHGAGVQFLDVGSKEREALSLHVQRKLSSVGSLKGLP